MDKSVRRAFYSLQIHPFLNACRNPPLFVKDFDESQEKKVEKHKAGKSDCEASQSRSHL